MHSIACVHHANRPCEFICTDLNSSQNIFKCDICIVNERIKGTNVISISQILQDNCSNSNTTDLQLFNNLPFKGMIEMKKKLKELVKSQTWECKIQEYCKKLSQDMQQQIEGISKAMQEKAKKLLIDYTRVEIINIYNDFSQKQSLKKIILDESMGLEKRSQNIKQIITEMLGQQHEHYLKIEEKMRELTERERLVNFQAAEKVKVKILEELSEISIFLNENVNNGGSQIVQQKNKIEGVNILNIHKGSSHQEGNNLEEKKDITNKEILDLSTYQNYKKDLDFSLSDINWSQQQSMSYSLQGLNIGSSTFGSFFQEKPEKKDNNIQDNNTSVIIPQQIANNPKNNSQIVKSPGIFQWEWVITGNSSGTIQLENQNNDGFRIISQKNSTCKIITKTLMLNDILYKFKCTFNKPLNGCKGVSIGLHDFMFREKIQFNNFDSFPGNGVKIKFKGGLLNEYPLNQQVKVIHFKVCIGQQIFFLTDETEQNINQGQKKYIDKEGHYNFGIFLEGISEDLDFVISHPKTGKYKG